MAECISHILENILNNKIYRLLFVAALLFITGETTVVSVCAQETDSTNLHSEQISQNMAQQSSNAKDELHVYAEREFGFDLPGTVATLIPYFGPVKDVDAHRKLTRGGADIFLDCFTLLNPSVLGTRLG